MAVLLGRCDLPDLCCSRLPAVSFFRLYVLQRRCYWQLDPERENIVLVHYLCCASSRAGGGAGARAGSTELAEPRERPRRGNAGRRAYSPPPAAGGARGGGRGRLGSQSKLSPLAQSSGSLESSLPSQGLPEVAELADVSPLALPLMQGMSLEQAAALPSLAQQYAQQQQHAQGRLAAALLPLPPLPAVELLPFDLPADDLSRPHPGVLYTGQRMASQLASAQQAAMAPPALPVLAPVASVGSVAPAAAAHPAASAAASTGEVAASSPQVLPPVAGLRALFPQESFAAEQHRNLFRQMSLGIQVWGTGRELVRGERVVGLQRLQPCLVVVDAAHLCTPPGAPAGTRPGRWLTLVPRPPAVAQRDAVEEVAGYYLGSPTERSLDPLAGGTAADVKPAAAEPSAAAHTGGDVGGGNPVADLAALLASPPHTGGHRRTFSRQGSGLSRLISKNWESELPVSACWGLLGGAWGGSAGSRR